jgi:enoyl-CoA hydratase
LTKTITEWSARKDIRIVILTGNGDKAFVGGVDVRAMMDLDPDGAERFITDLRLCFLAIRQAEPIIIASINGFALRGGLEMVAACDLRIASVIEAALLPRLIGLGRAADMVLGGEMIDAIEAERIGLIHKRVPQEALKEATLNWAEQLLRNGPPALILQKRTDRSMDGIKSP